MMYVNALARRYKADALVNHLGDGSGWKISEWGHLQPWPRQCDC